MSTSRKSIPPNPPRWTPNPDPASIVIPGLDTEASTTDQIEQIEQLITIKLQNIDENFSKIHHALATKLLPAVKRYAVGTEPVREAAKFWTSFYEQAAQIRIPTMDDYSTVNETPSEREETESSSQDQQNNDNTPQNLTIQQDQGVYETSTVNSETSFLPGQGAFSSTPAISRLGKSNNGTYRDEISEQPSWTPSLESPLVRLNREINNFSDATAEDSLIPSQSGSHATPSVHQDESINSTFRPEDVSILPASEKGKGKDTSHPLLRNVLRHNLYSTSDNSTFENKPVSPLKFRKPKTPTIDKKLNPYLSAEASPAQWSGVVDLRDPSVLTPQKKGKSTKASNPTTAYDDDDDSFDGLPPGMSPPVLMSPARPPRSSAVLERIKLGQTPARDATARIQRDLLRDAQYKSRGHKTGGAHGGGYYDSSMSTVPTPPSLSRYQRENDYSNSSNITKDSSLEDMIQRIRNDIRPDVGNTPGMPTPGLRIRPRMPPISSEKQPVFHSQNQRSYSPGPSEPATPMYNQMQEHHDDLDDSLDLDEVNNTAHPSAAFLMASQGVLGQYDGDNSFDSSNNSVDSLADEDVIGTTGIIPVHPFAQAGPVVEDDGFDDDDESFDGFETQRVGMIGAGQYDGPEEETLFGLAPNQRMAHHGPTGELRMLGDDLLQDTIGIGTHIASSGRTVDESPTPASWAQR